MYSVFMYFPLQTTRASQVQIASQTCGPQMYLISFPLWLRHEADKDDTVEMDAMAIRVWSKWLLLTSWLYVNYAMGVTWTIWRDAVKQTFSSFFVGSILKSLTLSVISIYQPKRCVVKIYTPWKVNIGTCESPVWRGNHLPNLHHYWLPC